MASSSKKRPARSEPEVRIVKDAPTLKALADPTRLQILMALGEGPKTVKDVAALLGLGATRLYYHFKILEKAELIRVARKRMVSGIEERTYEATAQSWTPAPEATSSLLQSGLIDALLEVVRAELELALGAQGREPLGDAASPVPIFSLTRLALSVDDVEEVITRIQQIQEDFIDLGPKPAGKRHYNVLFAGYQIPSELNVPATEEEAS